MRKITTLSLVFSALLGFAQSPEYGNRLFISDGDSIKFNIEWKSDTGRIETDKVWKWDSLEVGTTISFGTENQIPSVNATTDDYDYSSNLTFDGATLTTLDIDADTLKLETGTEVNDISTDGTLSGDSDFSLVTEKAIKTYIDNSVSDTALVALDELGTASDYADSAWVDNVYVTNNIKTASIFTELFYITNTGDTTAANTWRYILEGNELVIYRKNSGLTWVEIMRNSAE